jgi:hypothetical protein
LASASLQAGEAGGWPPVPASPDASGLSPELEPLPDEPEVPPLFLYNPPRAAAKTARMSPEASTAVIVNYLEEDDAGAMAAAGQAGELGEEEDMDIDLLDVANGHESIRLAARPMAPAPKQPL